MINKKVLVIDIGHGGSDSGAYANGIKEKDANIITGLAAAQKLRDKGFIVFLTRETDTFISLEGRVTTANNLARKYGKDNILFISIHHNAGGGDRAEGIYSIYLGDSETLANAITLELYNQLGQQTKTYSKKGTDNKDYYYVIRNTVMPAVIVEVAFLDHAEDVQICDTPEEQKRNGGVIADAIIKWHGAQEVAVPVKPQEPISPPKVPGTNDIISKYKESGKAVICVNSLNVRTAPTTDASIRATYNNNDYFYYDEVVITNGFVWCGYTSYSGERSWVAVKNRTTGERYANCY